ncbi:kinase-like domain-containing protein [Amanita rubescens]|nr:kinase-like domain-containing protein [Amanita rubescens]
MPTRGRNKFPWALWKNRDLNDRLYSPGSPGLSSGNSSGNSSPNLPRSAPASYRELPEDLLEENTHLSPKLTSSGGNLSPQSSVSALFGLSMARAESPKSEPPSTPDMHRIDSDPSTQALTVSLRPWEDTPRHHWFVSPEQMVMHDETRKRVAQAVSCGLSVAGDTMYDALFVGVKIMEFSPVPGLEACGRTLLQIWDTMQQVALNRMRCLRLAMRAADFMISIRREIARLNDVVGRELQQPVNTFEETLVLVLSTLHRQITLPGWIRYLRRDELSEQIDNCNTALGDCLSSFDRSMVLRIMDNMFTRRQSANVPLLLQPMEEQPQKSLDDLDILITDLPSESGNNLSEEPSEEKWTLWKQLIEQDDEADNARDERDYRVLLEHAIFARDEAQVIQLLQIGHSELPRALKGLLKEAFELRREKDQLKGSHQDWHHPDKKRGRSETWPPDAFVAAEATGERRGGSGQGVRRRLSTKDSESMFQRADAMWREHRGLPSVVRSWAVTREDIRLGDIIGRGRFSTVYKGIWHGRTVAVKVLNPNIVSTNDFDNELTIWRSLSAQPAQGGNVLKLYGSSAFAGGLPRMLLSPYVRHGSLSDYLKRCEWEAMGEGPALFLQPGSYHKVDHLTIMHDIARGMEFIHSSGVLHGDLRASNVLITDQFRCIISDFGSSRRKQDITIYEESPTTLHSLRWQPPEIIASRSLLTEHVDVYAFAMTCIEVVTFGNWPWPTLSDEQIRDTVLKKRLRPPYPDLVKSLGVEGLLRSCWHDAPASRPSFKDVVRLLRKLRYPTPC